MREVRTVHPAPRHRSRVGAHFVWRPWALLLAGVLLPQGARAQDPPVPVPGDTVAAELPDSARVAGTEAGDTLTADTLGTFHNLPKLEARVPEGWEAGVWRWDHDQIMASGANTLVELVDEVPGVIPLRTGDYGNPSAFSAFGTGGGGVRVFVDGFELLPLAGGVVDLERVGISGIETVVLRREPGRATIELTSMENEDPRPYSLVEAGTGDFDNNLFRGTFTAPRALRGSVGLAIERTDTRGTGLSETGSRTGSWLRYQLHRGDDAGISVDFRTMESKSEVPDFPSPASRSDLTLRARARLSPGVVGELLAGRSTHDVGDDRAPFLTEGGTRTQYGVRVAADRGDLWARGAFRIFRGDELANDRADVEVGWSRPGLGGVRGRLTREGWRDEGPLSHTVSGWIQPFSVLTLFGSRDAGEYGARSGPIQDAAVPVPDEDDPGSPLPVPDPFVPEPTVLVTERTAYRAGASLSLRGLSLSGALLGLDDDVALPLGLAMDAGAPTASGADRSGWEVYGVWLGPFDGLRWSGSYQEWDVPGPYLPERVYRAAAEYHQVFMESGNLELWLSIGLQGHDAMQVFQRPGDGAADSEGLAAVASYERWDARLQVRIVTLRIFAMWENLANRQDLELFPGRPLPGLRTSFGIRWDMLN